MAPESISIHKAAQLLTEATAHISVPSLSEIPELEEAGYDTDDDRYFFQTMSHRNAIVGAIQSGVIRAIGEFSRVPVAYRKDGDDTQHIRRDDFLAYIDSLGFSIADPALPENVEELAPSESRATAPSGAPEKAEPVEEIPLPPASFAALPSGSPEKKAQDHWLLADQRDPKPEQPWYTAARYFARALIKDDPTLLTKRNVLAAKVSQSLAGVGLYKRGGKKPLGAGTVLKAFANVVLA